MVSIAATLAHRVAVHSATLADTADGVSLSDRTAKARVSNSTRLTGGSAHGLTLIELVITLAVVGVVAALAAPAFDRLMREMRLTAATDGFYTQIVTARSEAIKRGSTVIMCKTGDPLGLSGGGHEPTCGDNIYPSGDSLPANTWSHGWLSYTTDPGERNYTPESGDVLTGTSDPDFSEVGVTVTSNSTGNPWLTFQGDGTLNEDELACYAVCDDRGVNHGRLITIFLDGEARTDELPTTTVTSCSPPDDC